MCNKPTDYLFQGLFSLPVVSRHPRVPGLSLLLAAERHLQDAALTSLNTQWLLCLSVPWWRPMRLLAIPLGLAGTNLRYTEAIHHTCSSQRPSVCNRDLRSLPQGVAGG